MMENKDAYMEKAQAQYEQLNARMDQLKAKAKEMKADAKIEAQQRISQLEGELNKAQDKMDNIKKVSDDSWQKLKTDLEQIWGDVKQSIDRTSKEISK